ncbi:MAG: hypothetical protein EPN38_05905 [Rhodanobacteraceae bacterium]|nr:MAG: hypothetical protein EPN38_05905 [Rhodanobacteraceae bacterium]
MDKNAFLDLIESLDQERRLNESLAFSSLDAADKARHAITARRDAAAIADIRRALGPKPRAGRRLPTNKRRFDAYLDTLLDSCFEPAGIWRDRSVGDRGLAGTSQS